MNLNEQLTTQHTF